MVIQQGDVLLTKMNVWSIKTKFHSNILAEGEATGHAHRVRGNNVEVVEDEDTGNLFVSANAPFEVVHEEHGTIYGEPGVYKVGRVQEYHHFQEEARAVQD